MSDATTHPNPGLLERVPVWARFALALLLQFAIIGSLVVSHLVVRDQGTPILLQVAPVDPSDPLRGDYLTYAFADISEVDIRLFEEGALGKGRTVYVPLARVGRTWKVTWGIRPNLPDPEERQGGVYIRGTVTSFYVDQAHITYGIEEYFVPEGKGDSLPPSTSVIARVFVTDDGRAMLDRLLFDGKAWP